MGRAFKIILILIVVVAVLAGGYTYLLYGRSDMVAAQSIARPLPTALLLKPIPDGTPNAEQLRHGQYLTLAGDCVACHAREGGVPFAGGFALNSPFGVIYTENLTSDQATGIGAWTPDQFYDAIHNGRGVHGEFLYPGLPYTYFTHVTRADSDAMLAFLKTVPPQSYTPPPNGLPFPFNTSAAVWLEHSVLSLRRVHARSAEIAGVEPRRLSGDRPRPLRRLPHTEEFSRGR